MAIPETFALVMRALVTAIVLAFGLCGCASSGSLPHLSQRKYEELVIAGDHLALTGPPLPPAIAKLNPLQVYGDHGNIVIALYRDDRVERGFYIIPNLSSYDPRLQPQPGWTFEPVAIPGGMLDSIFQYSRIR